MSLVPRSLHQMRIIAVPLTRPKSLPRGRLEPAHSLTYYQFQLSSPKSTKPDETASADKTRGKSRWLPEEGVVNYFQSKAAGIWSGFGKSKQGSWQLKVYQAGERLMDRIEFEELALKGFDPSLYPSLARAPPGLEKKPRIPLIYPSSLSSDTDSLIHFRTLLEHRVPRHRRGLYLWMIIAPFTAPFMIIPVIPNLPFFFCVWRSWSHYKAYRSSQYLHGLLKSGSIVPEPSEALDAIVKEFATPVTPAASEGPQQATHEFVLTRNAVPAITKLFELKENSNADMYRAIEQARLRLEGKRSERRNSFSKTRIPTIPSRILPSQLDAKNGEMAEWSKAPDQGPGHPMPLPSS
ncbi:hypothetical protein D9756_004997 [Leucocoprinus leucothites]|uniref:Mitochondrial K+-H+ exchange-related-domain-containing protein n=1 Tax=Leucocoprinus leucothites TaxID=201217 RepID=A0A8H5LKA7_9AGAR|nr:hypothetical protein D9756_004997 [Leucoagaricus leucothites]